MNHDWNTENVELPPRSFAHSREIIGLLTITTSIILGSSVLASPAFAEDNPTHPAKSATDDKIHVMAFEGSDAIILESNGRFAFVDSGEDADYPDGSDPRYPLQPNTTRSTTYDKKLFQYLDSLGVNETNVDFYLGTHPHSDHIGTADEVIYRYRPHRVYTPEYDDSWITEPARLWDNQYVYDRLVSAAKETGAHLIQHLAPGAPLIPDDDNPGVASPEFDFGDMHIEIVHYGEEYHHAGAIADANEIAWGVKVTAHGHSAFLASDIQTTHGAEHEVAQVVGDVDFLKLGHHGTYTSNSEEMLTALHPEIAVQTGSFAYMFADSVQVLERIGTEWYPVDEVLAAGYQALVVNFADDALTISDLGNDVFFRRRFNASPYVTAYSAGHPIAQYGWHRMSDGTYFWFENSPYATENDWIHTDRETYYAGSNAQLTRGWAKIDSSWYLFSSTGTLQKNQWVSSNGRWSYLNTDGQAVTGWQEVNGVLYHFDDNAVMSTNAWAQRDGHWYYLNSNGHPVTNQWLSDNGAWYYLTASGATATGWKTIGGTSYYFLASGAMASGQWIEDNGTWYYASPSGFLERNAWKQSGNTWYYLTASGAASTGWTSVNGIWYYFFENASMASSQWVKDNERWYYLASSGAMETNQWKHFASDWYYLTGSGASAVGWYSVGHTWYHFGPDARMQSNTWVRETSGGASKYFLGPTGAMATNQWALDGAEWYYLSNSGSPATGWQAIRGSWYYLGKLGRMVTGTIQIGEKTYSFEPTGRWISSVSS